MSDTAETFCVCSKPAQNRCSACKNVSYCSPECQRRDWKNHKVQCKLAASQSNASAQAGVAPRRVGTEAQMNEIMRVGASHTIFEESMALGLDPSLISGATPAEFYAEKDGSENFWRLEAPIREQWEAKAEVHNRKSHRFWTTYFTPISTGKEWVDVVLDAILYNRLPSNGNSMWQDQVNANILAGLFPHLRKFTPAQNTALLDIFANRFWCNRNGFRLETGAGILFAHGKPTTNLLDQLIGRCLSWTRPYDELDALLSSVALPMQKHWPDIVGSRILDLAFAMLSPGRPSPAGGRTVPGDKILQIAETSPAACKHLLPVVTMMCRANMISNPASQLLDLFESFGVSIRGQHTSVLPWLMVEFVGDDTNTQRLQKLLKDETGGKLDRFGIEAKDFALAELRELNRAAMERLGNPHIL
ncbi:hypothetical protein C8R43DRAFT_1239436 [Mycena crocata]|nr:hypothetical protein C8R43DRAFT_1239436 [Mycena crocata]